MRLFGWEGTRCLGAGSISRWDCWTHTVVHPDGLMEDSWGKADVRDIAQRLGIVEFQLSREVLSRVVNNLQRNSPELYDAAVAKAKELIQT